MCEHLQESDCQSEACSSSEKSENEKNTQFRYAISHFRLCVAFLKEVQKSSFEKMEASLLGVVGGGPKNIESAISEFDVNCWPPSCAQMFELLNDVF
jgi:hypothetical protein